MRARALIALCCWVAVSSFSAPAAPCGAFVAQATKTVPSLAVEQTLIVFDPEQELEHERKRSSKVTGPRMFRSCSGPRQRA